MVEASASLLMQVVVGSSQLLMLFTRGFSSLPRGPFPRTDCSQQRLGRESEKDGTQDGGHSLHNQSSWELTVNLNVKKSRFSYRIV